jgi:hypothetical protein
MEIEPMKTVDQVTLLIAKAAESHDSNDALKFSQAACNAANALCALRTADTTLTLKEAAWMQAIK